MIATLMVSIKFKTEEIDISLMRHMILNSIRFNRVKFGKEYGELVIACDASNNWRKDFFPYYKANRKKNRDESALDWNKIFESLNAIRDELKDYMPYKVVHVEKAEADDIIAVLTKYHCNEKILILSGDKDLIQLQRYPNVTQWNPVQKKFVSENNPDLFLQEHIIRGDKVDNIVNILTNDNALILGERQKTISNKMLQSWLNKTPEEFCKTEYMLRNYKRNKILIDLNCIPPILEQHIINQYECVVPSSRSNLINYFMKYKLKNLIDSISEF